MLVLREWETSWKMFSSFHGREWEFSLSRRFFGLFSAVFIFSFFFLVCWLRAKLKTITKIVSWTTAKKNILRNIFSEYFSANVNTPAMRIVSIFYWEFLFAFLSMEKPKNKIKSSNLLPSIVTYTMKISRSWTWAYFVYMRTFLLHINSHEFMNERKLFDFMSRKLSRVFNRNGKLMIAVNLFSKIQAKSWVERKKSKNLEFSIFLVKNKKSKSWASIKSITD